MRRIVAVPTVVGGGNHTASELLGRTGGGSNLARMSVTPKGSLVDEMPANMEAAKAGAPVMATTAESLARTSGVVARPETATVATVPVARESDFDYAKRQLAMSIDIDLLIQTGSGPAALLTQDRERAWADLARACPQYAERIAAYRAATKAVAKLGVEFGGLQIYDLVVSFRDPVTRSVMSQLAIARVSYSLRSLPAILSVGTAVQAIVYELTGGDTSIEINEDLIAEKILTGDLKIRNLPG